MFLKEGFLFQTIMKTLFENLKEEHKMQLEVMKEIYPNSHERLVKTLQDNYVWSLLTISDAYTLILNTTNKSFSVTNLSELFYE
jgi:hypothetical protein